jgi:hypothetical protein
MTESTIPQISEQDGNHDAQTEDECTHNARHMHIEEGEEDPRIGLLVDVGFPICVHCKHLGCFFFFFFDVSPPMIDPLKDS